MACSRDGADALQGGVATAGRKRAAVELIARRGAELRQVARRYSLCEEDAEDAYQRALEILLLKAPSERPRDLIRWTRTVVKHEALALRANRERLLGTGEDEPEDSLARLPAANPEPEERLERRERIARSREALRALKPAEQRSLTLLAAGYTYAEIGQITGYSNRKVERSLVEGRERFRRLLAAGEEGARCAQLRPLLSVYCDREASAAQSAAVREHLRACAACRATMRAYRAAPATVAALAPSLPLSRSLLERAQELLLGVQARLPGGGATGEGATQVATASGAGGAGIAAFAKGLAVCAGTVGAATACVATGVAPAPLAVGPERAAPAKVERVAERVVEEAALPAVEYEPAPDPVQPVEPEPQPEPEPEPVEAEPAPEASAGAVEYAPPPEPPPAPSTPAASSAGSAAGEFGP
jgi:RNA polymerase sigma factor (sigma-70 family)